MLDKHSTLAEVGEKTLVSHITNFLGQPASLVDGYGHDAAFLDIDLGNDELLALNTDRSGLNLAYQLGLADAECVGDLGVSHAISDIVAGGAEPIAVTLALLMPPDTTIEFVEQVVSGAKLAAARYGAFIAGGDSKQNPKFAVVVTAIGKVKRQLRLGRSGVAPGDVLATTGYFGSMLLGSMAFKRNLDVTEQESRIMRDALVRQRPPYELGIAISSAGVASSCMDISDGLASALYSMTSASGLGALIQESQLPIDPGLADFANKLGLSKTQLSFAGGDWQYLYSFPETKFDEAEAIASGLGEKLIRIGKAVDCNFVSIKTTSGHLRHLGKLEHDSFKDRRKGKGYFDLLSEPQSCFGPHLNPEEIMSLET